ncbi:cytochrome c-type biogenesis protein [Pseudodonghicola flavimaris]|uniref:Cytochrome c-type biogenesis protein n=1 Tax=Pseudodonghicola flavimaris TaxID=3050036 RepID=A0ABT7F1N0_9RHOB|nr:cytochrome c-type biogenesis protein [Pseudodonghicola flavimaris]MDK3018503.1 cytochrome c-type biogenesis protein CcmH [Pseudodonghicola flavimaris]
MSRLLQRVGALWLVLLIALAPAAQAVLPDEILADPALEARAREISKDLRCLVCRNENIDESNAELARDLRLLVRERLTAGDSDEEVVAYIVDRYGEYVLLRPTATGANWLLWGAGPLMLLIGAGLAWGYLRARARAPRLQEAALTDEEQDRLRRILDDE